ncbi:MAG: phosphoglycerate mutase [Rhodanobacter sp.]
MQLWLPALKQVEPSHPLLECLHRADRLDHGRAGYLNGFATFFPGMGEDLPAAAITREFVAGDAADALWLAADPAWVRPDMTGARLLACGQLQLSIDEAHALAHALRPLFDELGMQLLVSTADRWHLQLPAGTVLPHFAAPEQALGEDLTQHLPAGAEGRRWRVLLNDIQITLHQLPLNAQRHARGLPPVNSLWLWGGGQLPAKLHSGCNAVISDDLLLRALAHRAGVLQHTRTPQAVASATSGCLIDLQDLPSSEIAANWWPILQTLLARHPVVLHFASGERWQHKPWHRWRFWRRAGH